MDDQEWIDRHDREHEVAEEHPDCEQCRVYIADRDYERKASLYTVTVERADFIAEAVTAGSTVAGFSGIDPNTRRIARAAAFRAVMTAFGHGCPQCHEVNGTHRWDCGFKR